MPGPQVQVYLLYIHSTDRCHKQWTELLSALRAVLLFELQQYSSSSTDLQHCIMDNQVAGPACGEMIDHSRCAGGAAGLLEGQLSTCRREKDASTP